MEHGACKHGRELTLNECSTRQACTGRLSLSSLILGLPLWAMYCYSHLESNWGRERLSDLFCHKDSKMQSRIWIQIWLQSPYSYFPVWKERGWEARQQEMLPERASFHGPHGGRSTAKRSLRSFGKENGTRIGEGLKGPKEKPLLRFNCGSGNSRSSLRELWRRHVTDTQFTLLFPVPQHYWGIPEILASDYTGTDWNGMWCSFDQISMCIERMRNKTESLLSGYWQSGTVLRNYPRFPRVLMDGHETPATWLEEGFWGLNSSWYCFILNRCNDQFCLSECMRIYRQKDKNTQAQAIRYHLPVTTLKMYSTRIWYDITIKRVLSKGIIIPYYPQDMIEKTWCLHPKMGVE